MAGKIAACLPFCSVFFFRLSYFGLSFEEENWVHCRKNALGSLAGPFAPRTFLVVMRESRKKRLKDLPFAGASPRTLHCPIHEISLTHLHDLFFVVFSHFLLLSKYFPWSGPGDRNLNADLITMPNAGTQHVVVSFNILFSEQI